MVLQNSYRFAFGFRVNSGEYKVMGLAPYGNPTYKDKLLEHVIDVRPDGSFRMDMSYFNYCQGLTMTSDKFHQLFGGPPRTPETEITQREMDLAASVQVVVEEVMLKMADYAHKKTGCDNLTMAGGVALNCVGNGQILRQGPFDQIWVQPAAGDAGGALGTASFIWHQLLERPRTPATPDRQHGSLLGPEFSDEEITKFLQGTEAKFDSYESDEELTKAVAKLLADENVVGWFQGRMEFGPRALGARSILGDARSQEMQTAMNLKIKYRESFRPFAPIVMREHVDSYFEMRPNEDSPYMLMVAPVREEIRSQLPESAKTDFGIDKLKHIRSTIPAVTHVDYSARVQTVDDQRNKLLYDLLDQFNQQTGCPVLINTSFNVRSEPIVCTPKDAYRCFMMTEMDVLVMGRQVIQKKHQREVSASERESHLAQFQLD